MITLQRMTATINNHNETAYIPSKLATTIVMSYKDFLAKYADYPKSLLLENGEITTGYNFGLGHWYVVIESEPEFEPVVVIRSRQ